jgi:hypothetical protein
MRFSRFGMRENGFGMRQIAFGMRETQFDMRLEAIWHAPRGVSTPYAQRMSNSCHARIGLGSLFARPRK